jgi:hypothetical protein
MNMPTARKHPPAVWIVLIGYALGGLEVVFGTVKNLLTMLEPVISSGKPLKVVEVTFTLGWGALATAVLFSAVLGLYFEKRWSRHIFLVFAIFTGFNALRALPMLLLLFSPRPSEPAGSAMRMAGLGSVWAWSVISGIFCVAATVIVYRYLRRVPESKP